jgi:hypothetical protein
MSNLTDFSSDSWLQDSSDLCEEVTNHWLYFIFAGYVLPLISPRVRDWFKETLNSLKNNEVAGQIVTLTEYGFDKIQDIENNKEMKSYIKRLCETKNPSLYYSDENIEKIAWLFSGESKDGQEGIQQSWKKLNKLINNSEYSIKVHKP